MEERRDVNSQMCGNLESVFPECGWENEGWKTKPPNCRYPAVECWLYRSLPPFRARPLTLRNRTLLWVRVRHSLKVWQTSGHLQAEKQKHVFAPTATSGPQRHSCGCCKSPHQGVFQLFINEICPWSHSKCPEDNRRDYKSLCGGWRGGGSSSVAYSRENDSARWQIKPERQEKWRIWISTHRKHSH